MSLGLLPESHMSSAVISKCGRYRYQLMRGWGKVYPPLIWVMLNPSTADSKADDNTIRVITRFSRGWGYGSLMVVNLFALRATSPKDLIKHPDPVGPENDDYISKTLQTGFDVVLAWGANTFARPRVAELIPKLKEWTDKPLMCLRVTKDGSPGHPLYVPGNIKPILFPTVAMMIR